MEVYALYIAPYVPSPPQVVQRMLAIAELKAGEVFFDLGAGDGRTVVMQRKSLEQEQSVSS